MKRKLISMMLTVSLVSSLLVGCGSSSGNSKEPAAATNTTKTEDYAGQKLTVLMAKTDDQDAINNAFSVFEKKYGVTLEVENTPGGDEGENIIKVRMATNSLSDIVMSSVGAKLRELDPKENLVDIKGESFLDNLDDGYIKSVTVDGGVYGVPISTSNVAGVYYNKNVYKKLGLSVPETWDKFMINCETIKKAGYDPIVAPYQNTGFTQIPFLANYYYVQAESPNFAEDYTQNKVSLSDTPAFVRGFEKMNEVVKKGYLNKDYLSTPNEEACSMLAEGTAAHFIIRSNILGVIAEQNPEAINDIGFFPLPDKDASVRGVTTWMPPAFTITKNAANAELAKKFLAFVASKEYVDAYTSIIKPPGVFLTKGVKFPEDSYPALIEAQEWIEKASTPAMEYFCPIKGSNQATICSQVASGSITPEEGIKQIEEDNKITAKQLGLKDWVK